MESDARESTGAPDASFVRDTYDTLLKSLPEGYTEYRWRENAVSRFHYRQSRRALLRALRYVPDRVGRILEIGGGDGAWTPFFAPRAKRIDFLDISEKMLAGARRALKQFGNIEYIQADFLAWEPESAAYDAVVSLRNLEYMSDKKKALARMAKTLSPGGTLILSTKNPQFDWHGYFEDKKLHGGQIPLPALTTLLAQCGFGLVRVYPAIIGKKTKYAPMRMLWDILQSILIRMPMALMPFSLLRYISESFLIVAKRI